VTGTPEIVGPNISGTMTDSIEISETNLGLLTSASSTQLEDGVPRRLQQVNNDRQPKMAIWPRKSEIFISLKLRTSDRIEIPTANPGLMSPKCWQVIAIAADNRK